MLAEVGRRADALEASNATLSRESAERREAEEALRVADRRKDEFLAMLAHELRNPLAPLRNALEILKRAARQLADGAGSAADDGAAAGADGQAGRRPARRVAHHDRQAALKTDSVELRDVIRSAVDTASR